MVKSLLDYYAYTKSYLILKFKNVVKFHVHIRPIFSCRVTYAMTAHSDNNYILTAAISCDHL